MDISVHHYLRVILSTFLRVLILMGLFSHLAISYSSGPRTVVHLQLIAQSITMGGDTATRRYRCSRQLHNINPNRGIKFMPTGWALHSHEHCDAVDLTFTRDRKFSNGSRSPAPRPLVPRLVLITGATGTGKSTLGMAVAFSEGMLKCVSTDTIREVARAYDGSDIVQRPSYGGGDDAVRSWLESVEGLDKSVRSVVDHTINRRKSMVLEGVSIAPSNLYIDQFKAGGGVGLGVLLKVSDETRHREHLVRRGFENQLKNFDRIRAIQSHMIELAEMHGWLQIDQAEIKDNVKEITTKLRALYP